MENWKTFEAKINRFKPEKRALTPRAAPSICGRALDMWSENMKKIFTLFFKTDPINIPQSITDVF